MNLSNMIGSRVCSIFEGKMQGYILDANITNDYKKLANFIIVNDEDEFTYLLPCSQIVAINEDIVFIKNENCLNLCDKAVPGSLMNKKAYYINGKSLGSIRDVVLKENMQIVEIVLDDIHIEAKKLIKVGEDICVFYENKRPKMSEFAPSSISQPTQPVKIMKMSETPKLLTPIKLTCFDTNCNLGRISSKTVLGKNNEIVVKQGQIITDEVLKKAKLHGIYLDA